MTDRTLTDTALDRKIEELSGDLLRRQPTDMDWSELERLQSERRRRLFDVMPLPEKLRFGLVRSPSKVNA